MDTSRPSEEDPMDQSAKDRIIDSAVMDILSNRDSIAVLVRVLNRVFGKGYGYGLSQGHHDRDFPEG